MANKFHIGLKEQGYNCKVMGEIVFTDETAAYDAMTKYKQDVFVSQVYGGYLFEHLTTDTKWLSENLDCKDDKFKAWKIAESIIEDYKIISVGDRQYIYKDNYYQYLPEKEIRRIIYRRNKSLSQRKRNEILDCIILDDSNSYDDVNRDYICFNNGLLNINSNEFDVIEHTPEIICTTKINHDFKPEKILDDSYEINRSLKIWSDGNNDIVLLLLEMAGYCLTYDTRMQKAFIITGDKANGKSAFIHFLQFCLGDNNYSSVDMGDLGNRFTTILLMDKLANISDDIADAYLSSNKESIFKKLVTGDTVSAEKKNVDPVKFNNFATMIFTCNEKPHSNDPTGALARRLVYIPFNHVFKDNERDYHIYEKLNTEDNAEAFITSAIMAYKTAAERGHFTISKAIKEANKEQRIENSPILRWAYEEIGASNTNVLKTLCAVPMSEMFKSFLDYCEKNNFYTNTTIQRFSKKIRSEFDLVSKAKKDFEGKVHKYFDIKEGRKKENI